MSTIDTSPVPDYSALARLDGKSAVVVGAGQGMGRQTAHALASAGATVLCVDVDRELAEQVASEVGGVAVVADVLSPDDIERVLDEAQERLGGIDVLVDIVGMARFLPFLDTGEEDWEWSFDIVLRHARLLMKGAARRMKESGGGSMVFIGSISALTSAPDHAAYGAAKSALLSLVRSASVELGPHAIRINAISPGLTRTPRLTAMIDARKDEPSIEPLGSVGDPSDIAGAALFLASGLSSHVTGQTLLVDGGASVLYAYTPR